MARRSVSSPSRLCFPTYVGDEGRLARLNLGNALCRGRYREAKHEYERPFGLTRFILV